MTIYDHRVDELAAELLERDVDGGHLEARREAFIHELLDLLASAYHDDELKRRHAQHPARVASGRRGGLRLVSGGR